MKTMKHIFAMICLGIAVITALPAQADTTYYYTGQDFTSIYPPDLTPPIPDYISGSMTLSTSLAPSTIYTPSKNFDSLVVSWSFTDGRDTWNSTDSSLSLAFGSTDSSGDLSGTWFIELGGTSGGLQSGNFFITNNASAVGGTPTTGDSIGVGFLAASNHVAGVWADGSLPSLTPEPSTLLLLGTGSLGVVALLHRRRKPAQ